MGEFILNGRNYGGSIITPNPSDTPTDSLDSIKINDTIYEIQGSGGGGSNLILDARKYSLDEQVVGIWTDGKPLYQKTINFGTLPNNTVKDLDHGISNVDKIWVFDGFAYQPNGDFVNQLSLCVPFNLSAGWYFGANKTIVRCETKTDRTAYSAFVTIQYTKTTDVAGSGGYQAYGFSPIVCSDTEREVGVWQDNKPLYQKTFVGTLGGTEGSDVSNYKMADLSDIDTIISISGTLQGITPINSYYASDNYNMVFVNGAKNGLYCNGKNIGGNTYKVTVQYTKASDTAGSGEYNTLAIPNVHYSTDEQVIGTWIDGKTLYQKTKIFPNTIAFSNDTVLDMEISNVDTIFVEEGYFYDFYANAIGKLPYSQDGNLQYTISVKVDISNKSHLKISSNTTFGVNSDRYIAVTVRYTKTTD